MASVLRSIKQTPSKFLVAITTDGYFAAASGTEDAGTLVLAGSKTTVTVGHVWQDLGKVQLISGETYLKIGRNMNAVVGGSPAPVIGYIPLNSQDGFHAYNAVLGWARI